MPMFMSQGASEPPTPFSMLGALLGGAGFLPLITFFVGCAVASNIKRGARGLNKIHIKVMQDFFHQQY